MPFNKPTKQTSYARSKPSFRAKAGLRASKKFLGSTFGTRASRIMWKNPTNRSRYYFNTPEEAKELAKARRKELAKERKKAKQLQRALKKLGIDYAE